MAWHRGLDVALEVALMLLKNVVRRRNSPVRTS